VNGDALNLTVEKLTKGILLDVEGVDNLGIKWSDNRFDIMPGDSIEPFISGF
jgi:hypothetical protein